MAWLMLASSLAVLATHRLIALFTRLHNYYRSTHVIDWQAVLLLVCITIIAIIRLRFNTIYPPKLLVKSSY